MLLLDFILYILSKFVTKAIFPIVKKFDIMAYFKNNYHNFKYPKLDDNNPGFRTAQLGAIHSAAGHFSNRSEAGIITMPTGSGKTAVLISLAFVLQAKRVLIITPSRLVREQIAEEISSLNTLKEIGALPKKISAPKVYSTRTRITSIDKWIELRKYDVVVATVQSISPEFKAIPEPPGDLFDLVLVDEAHHSPARTWQSVLEHFNSAKRILFTATPFRQDQKEIKGKFIFTYDLKEAFSDGIFGEINYSPVIPAESENHDEAIAKMAEIQFQSDCNSGLNHRIMVRTDNRARAKELLETYRRITKLRLEIVTGNNTLRYVKNTIKKLKNGELDGVICVNMMGEGFNFPDLKIAAIHAPHKSLSVTLQFIGRFARTAGEKLGPATFLAIPSEIEIETEKLYDTRAVWQKIVHNLAATRVAKEAEDREILQTFNDVNTIPDLSDLSLYVLEPYYHVKVYQFETDIDIENDIVFPSKFQVVYHAISHENNAVIYITREVSVPRWTTDDRLSNLNSDLFIFYYDTDTKLFFICASAKSPGIYEEIISSFIGADPHPLPLVRLNKALNDLQATEFFNVGMRNRIVSSTTESYRIITGSSADKSVLKSDSRLYHRGHAFGRASENGESITIGLSSASKIWSNKSSKLPEFIAWCKKLSKKISSNRVPITNSGLDFLDPGEVIEQLPEDIISVDWPTTVYRNSVLTSFIDKNGNKKYIPLLDFDISIIKEPSLINVVLVKLTYDQISYKFTFSFETDRFFEPFPENETEIFVEHDRGSIPIIQYINQEMLLFYTSDLSLIDGYNIFRAPEDFKPILDDRVLEKTDWESSNVDIECEFGDAKAGKISLHEYIESLLLSSDAEIVYYDHGTGEIADFISLRVDYGKIIISFYHCKKSPSSSPGHRLDSVDELVAQIVKSVIWTSKHRILQNIKRRFTHKIGSHKFIKGDIELLESFLTPASSASIEYKFIAVQPGLKKEKLPTEISNILASANDHLVRAGFKPLQLLSS